MDNNTALGIILGHHVDPRTQQPYSERSREYMQATNTMLALYERISNRFAAEARSVGMEPDDLASRTSIKILVKGKKNRMETTLPTVPRSSAYKYIETTMKNLLIDEKRRLELEEGMRATIISTSPDDDGNEMDIVAPEKDAEEERIQNAEDLMDKKVALYKQSFYDSWIKEVEKRYTCLAQQVPAQKNRFEILQEAFSCFTNGERYTWIRQNRRARQAICDQLLSELSQKGLDLPFSRLSSSIKENPEQETKEKKETKTKERSKFIERQKNFDFAITLLLLLEEKEKGDSEETREWQLLEENRVLLDYDTEKALLEAYILYAGTKLILYYSPN